MFCTNCGSQFEDGNAFCPNCGTKVEVVNSVAQPAAAPVAEAVTAPEPVVNTAPAPAPVVDAAPAPVAATVAAAAPVAPAPVAPVYDTQAAPAPSIIYEQPGYQNQANGGSNDPNYEANAGRFLKVAILNCIFCALPIGSFICMGRAKKFRNELLEYIGKGFTHTNKIKTCSALLRAAQIAGKAYTIFYGIVIAYYAVVLTMAIFSCSVSAFG